MVGFRVEQSFTFEGREIVNLNYGAVGHRGFLHLSFATRKRDATTEIQKVRSDPPHDEYLFMRNRAAALLILTLTTSCSRAPRHDERSATPPTTPQTKVTTTIGAASTTSAPTASTVEPSTAIGGSQPTPPVVAMDSSTAATRVVDQLITGVSAGTVPAADLWSGVVAGGHVIQSTVLAESADRATVAVSLAFEPTTGEPDIEPIGLRVELFHGPDRWDVIAIGYL